MPSRLCRERGVGMQKAGGRAAVVRILPNSVDSAFNFECPVDWRGVRDGEQRAGILSESHVLVISSATHHVHSLSIQVAKLLHLPVITHLPWPPLKYVADSIAG